MKRITGVFGNITQVSPWRFWFSGLGMGPEGGVTPVFLVSGGEGVSARRKPWTQWSNMTDFGKTLTHEDNWNVKAPILSCYFSQSCKFPKNFWRIELYFALEIRNVFCTLSTWKKISQLYCFSLPTSGFDCKKEPYLWKLNSWPTYNLLRWL